MNLQPSPNCLNCGSEAKILFVNGKDFFVNDGNSNDFIVLKCSRCEVAHSLPVLDNKQLSFFYPKDFEAYVTKKSIGAWLQKKKYNSDLNKIRSYIQYNNRVSLFEIGAGRGEFLKSAKDKNFDVDGCEPFEAGIDLASTIYKIEIKKAYADDFIFEKPYQVVVLRHVLEHINDYKACLENIYSFGLKKNGILFLKLPAIDGWEAKLFKRYWHGFDLPRHRVHFSKNGIRKILIQLGFVDVKISNEAVYIDILRSLKNYKRFGNRKSFKILASIATIFPNFLNIFIFQVFSSLFSIFGAGRMIVLARKP